MKAMARIGFLFLLALVLAACSGGGSREPTYSISGVVVDKDGQGIEGVILSITGGTTMTVTSGEGGQWTASGLRGEVTVTPVGSGLEFEPPFYRISSRSTDEVNFTAHLTHEVPRAWYTEGYVSGMLEEKVYGPRYIRTYTFVLKFTNNTGVDGRVMVWAYIHGRNVGIWTKNVPVGRETWVEIRSSYYSDDINDNIFTDGFEVIIEGAANVPPGQLIEVDFLGWPE